MKKEVLLCIKGLQISQDNASENMEIIVPGEYYYRNNKHFFLYEEVMEGQTEITKNIIKVKKDYLELTKKGVTNVHMIFEKNKKHNTYYYTPYGSLLVGIDAYRVDIEESEDEMVIEIEYELEMNQEHIANCQICIRANARSDKEAFPLG